MEITPVTIDYYETLSGRHPFREWFDSLDESVQEIIDARLVRVRRGLFGEAKPVGGGVFELIFHVGSGYRVYGARHGKTVVILLQGGDKKKQSDDIKTAREYWVDYLRRVRK